MLLPVICDKCEFGVQTTVLLRESRSDELLDTTRTLNELGLRELFARDTGSGWAADLERQTATPEAGERLPVWTVSLNRCVAEFIV